MINRKWTPSLVAEHFEEASDVLRQLPPVRFNGYFSVWPQIKAEFNDLMVEDPRRMKRPPPSPIAISRMEEVLGWTCPLEPVDAKIIWLKARRKKWKEVCWRVGLSRANAHLHWMFALCLVTWQLNGRKVNSSWGMKALIERTEGE